MEETGGKAGDSERADAANADTVPIAVPAQVGGGQPMSEGMTPAMASMLMQQMMATAATRQLAQQFSMLQGKPLGALGAIGTLGALGSGGRDDDASVNFSLQPKAPPSNARAEHAVSSEPAKIEVEPPPPPPPPAAAPLLPPPDLRALTVAPPPLASALSSSAGGAGGTHPDGIPSATDSTLVDAAAAAAAAHSAPDGTAGANGLAGGAKEHGLGSRGEGGTGLTGERKPDTASPLRQGATVMGKVVEHHGDGALGVRCVIGGKAFTGAVREVRGAATFDQSRGGPVPIRAQPSVIIIGAGFAGLAAGDELHALGCKVVMVEARDRIGGRCWTDDSLDGRLVDLGAAWIHGIVGNPLAELARRAKVDLYHIPSEMLMHDSEGKPVSIEEDLKVESIFNEMLEQVKTEMASRPGKTDQSLGVVLEQLAGKHELFKQPANRQLFLWHVANIEYSTATDIHNLSARNWSQDDENAFDGDHCLLKKGYVSLAESLAKGLDIRLGAKVSHIDYAGDGREPCKVSLADGGTLTADLVLVTVPLGVLKSNSITFSPMLPKWKQTAIDKLGFGTLNKVVLAFKSNFWRSATPKGKYIGYASQTKGEYYMFIDITDSATQPTLLALVSGAQALELEQSEDADIVAGALRVLRLIVGDAIVEVPTGYKITRWGSDPFARGSYSYVSVGCTPLDMDALARPLDGNRVFFAGEHTNSEYPASVHGAFISGRREARHILRVWHDLPLPDVIAYGAPVGEDDLCALCGRPDDHGPEGPFVGPFRMAGKGNTTASVHEQCALCCPEVSKEGPHWYNVCKAIRRARRSKCTACMQPGATIGCYVETCKVNLHWHCAVHSGWDFAAEKLENGKAFFCQRHRKNSSWHAVHAGSKLNAWPNVTRPVGGADAGREASHDEKRRRLLPSMHAHNGAPIWVNCRPISLLGLPVGALRRISANPVAAALAPDHQLRAMSPASPEPQQPSAADDETRSGQNHKSAGKSEHIGREESEEMGGTS